MLPALEAGRFPTPDWAAALKAKVQLADGRNWREVCDRTLADIQEIRTTEWWLVGPFPFPDRQRRDYHYGPEDGFEAGKAYQGTKGEVRWRRLEFTEAAKAHQYIEFTELLEPRENGIAYAYTPLAVPADGMYRCSAVYDDTFDVWVNGEKVHANPRFGRYTDEFALLLRAGTNHVIVRVGQGGGAWGVQLRFFTAPPRRRRIAVLYRLLDAYGDDEQAAPEILYELSRQLTDENEAGAALAAARRLWQEYPGATLALSRKNAAYETFQLLMSLDAYRSAFAIADAAVAGELSDDLRRRYHREAGQWAFELGLVERSAAHYREYIKLIKESEKDAYVRRLLFVEKSAVSAPAAPPVSEELAEEWRRAELTRDMGNWPQYAEALHNILKPAGSVLLERDDGALVGIFGDILTRLRELPPDAYGGYVRRHSPAASRALSEARDSRSAVQLERLARAWPALPEAALALNAAGDLYMEAGEWPGAMHAYLNALYHGAADPSAMAAKAMAAAGRAGERIVLEALAQRYAAAEVAAGRSLAGGTVGYGSYAAAVTRSAGKPPAPGAASAAFRGLHTKKRLRSRFTADAAGARAAATQAGFPYRPHIWRDGRCYLQVDRYLWALGADGRPTWTACPTAAPAPAVDVVNLQIGETRQRIGCPNLQPASDSQRVFARMLWLDTERWNLQQGGDTSGRWTLFAFDASDGRLLWSSADMPELADMTANSNPLVVAGKVVCVWLRPGEIIDLLLTVHEPQNGELTYSLPLATGCLQGLDDEYFPTWLSSTLSYRDGILYVDTAAGALVAVDFFHGAFLWAARYPRRLGWEHHDWRRALERPLQPPVLADDVVAAWPRDSEVISVFSAADGRPVWSDIGDHTQQLVGAVRPAGAAYSSLLFIESGTLVARLANTGETLLSWRPADDLLLVPAATVGTDGVAVRGEKRLYLVKFNSPTSIEVQTEAYPDGWSPGALATAGERLLVLGRDALDAWGTVEGEQELPGSAFAAAPPFPEAPTSCEPGSTLRAFVKYAARGAATGGHIPHGYAIFTHDDMLAYGRVTPDFRILWRRNLPGLVNWRTLDESSILVLLRHELLLLRLQTGELVWRTGIAEAGGRGNALAGGDYEHLALAGETLALANREHLLLIERSSGRIRQRVRMSEQFENANIRGITGREAEIAAVYYDTSKRCFYIGVFDASDGSVRAIGVPLAGTGYGWGPVGFSEDGKVACLYRGGHEGMWFRGFDTLSGQRLWEKELKADGVYSRLEMQRGFLLMHLPHEYKPHFMILEVASGKELMKNEQDLRVLAWGSRYAVFCESGYTEKPRMMAMRLPGFELAWETRTVQERDDRMPRVALDEERDLFFYVVPRPGRSEDRPFHWLRLSDGQELLKLPECGLSVSGVALIDGAAVVMLPDRIAVFSGGPLAQAGESAAVSAPSPRPAPLARLPAGQRTAGAPEELALWQSQRQLRLLAAPDGYEAGWLREVDAQAGSGSFWDDVPKVRLGAKQWLPLMTASPAAAGPPSVEASLAVARDRDVHLHIEIKDDRLVPPEATRPHSGDRLTVVLGNPQPRSLLWGSWRDNKWLRLTLLPGLPAAEPEHNIGEGNLRPTLVARGYDFARDVLVYDFRIPALNCLKPPKGSTLPDAPPVPGIMSFEYLDDDGSGRHGCLAYGGSIEIPGMSGSILYMPRTGEFAPSLPTLKRGERIVLRYGALRIGAGEDSVLTWRTRFSVSGRKTDGLLLLWLADTVPIGDSGYGRGFYGSLVWLNGREVCRLNELRGERVSPGENWLQVWVRLPADCIKDGENTLAIGYPADDRRRYSGFDVSRVSLEFVGE